MVGCSRQAAYKSAAGAIGARQRRLASPSGSGRIDHLAAGVGDAARGLLTRHQRLDREHVVGVALPADAPGPRRCCASVGGRRRGSDTLPGCSATSGGSSMSSSACASFDALQRLRLLRRQPHAVHRDVAEPMPRGRGLAGRLAEVGDELRHVRHVRAGPTTTPCPTSRPAPPSAPSGRSRARTARRRAPCPCPCRTARTASCSRSAPGRPCCSAARSGL